MLLSPHGTTTLTMEQADRAATSRTRARLLRHCLSRGMPRDQARAYARRASSNYSEARRRLRTSARRTADAACCAHSTAQQTHSTADPPSPPSSGQPCGYGMREHATESAMATARAPQRRNLEDSIRREYQQLAPYIERVEELVRVAESLRRRPSSRDAPWRACPHVSLEFTSPGSAAGEADTSLVFIDGEAFFQQSHVSADHVVSTVRVSDVFSFQPSSSTSALDAPTMAPATPPTVALARLLRGQHSRVWRAMSLEAIVRSNMAQAGTELYFESTTKA